MVSVSICFAYRFFFFSRIENNNAHLANSAPRNGLKIYALQWLQNPKGSVQDPLSQTNWMIIIFQILVISIVALVSAFTTTCT